MVRSALATLGLLAAIWSSPVLADVKAGVDAWSRGDYATAVKEWRQPAINGDADAQFNLGQAYKLGRGVPVDLKAAEEWYRKASLQGHLQAEDNYALILFQNGDRQKSLPYIQKSAGRGEPRAQYILATALFNGDMVKKDWPRAYALMTRASAAGLGAASASLAEMDRYIPLDQRQKGLVMARALEEQAARPMPLPDPVMKGPSKPVTVIRTEALPSSKPPVTAPKPAPKRVVKTMPPEPKPQVAIASPKSSKPAAGQSGNWRIQLGAFSDPTTAKKLWATLQGKSAGLSGLQPFYVKAGSITRLQAGRFESKATAEKACASLKSAAQPCFPVAS